MVDRLLASPQYGERWARHWLDVVHFGETHGYDKDKPRVNAWPYRDYVIRAFNEDKPYWRFVQEQVAGDVLFPGTMDGIQALGFISAGPWDLIGHVEVSETRIDGKITRHLDRDDMVANTMSTFTSMTVSCAQCHDHKFDPITMEDYYSLHAVFAALDRADRPYDADPKILKQREALGQRENELTAAAKNIEAKLKRHGGVRLADLDSQIAKASKLSSGVRRPETGYHSDIEAGDGKTKWVQVDLGEPRTIERISITGCYDTFNDIGAGFGFPKRFKIEVSDDPKFERGVDVVVDRTSRDVANPGTAPQAFAVACAGRYVRVTAQNLRRRSAWGRGSSKRSSGSACRSIRSVRLIARWASRRAGTWSRCRGPSRPRKARSW